MKVGYIGGFWATNIGNSFYNIGMLNLLGRAFGNDNVFFIPDPPQWYWPKLKKDYKIIENLDLDLFIVSGPCLCKDLINIYNDIFDSLTKKGKKISFISAGAAEYTEEEAILVARFLNKFKIEFIITRDNSTYNLYKDKVNTNIIDGICTSMFLNDSITFLPNINDEYIIYNFHPRKEPVINLKNNNWSYKHSIFSPLQKELLGRKIIRTNNSTFVSNNIFFQSHDKMFKEKLTYYSDLPYGYFALLNSAKYVFSDRVHTCAAALIFGNKAMYIKGSRHSRDGRNKLFSRLGVENIYNEPVRLDFIFVNEEKEKMLYFLKKYQENKL